MSLTSEMINRVLEEIHENTTEYYGAHITKKHLDKMNVSVVCTDKDCGSFIDTQQVQPGQVIWVELNGELESFMVN